MSRLKRIPMDNLVWSSSRRYLHSYETKEEAKFRAMLHINIHMYDTKAYNGVNSHHVSIGQARRNKCAMKNTYSTINDNKIQIPNLGRRSVELFDRRRDIKLDQLVCTTIYTNGGKKFIIHDYHDRSKIGGWWWRCFSWSTIARFEKNIQSENNAG